MIEEQGTTDLAGLLAPVLARAPDAPAIVDDEGTLSYAGLWSAARRAATGLAGLGVGEGDRVALWLPNVAAWPILFLGCALRGAIVVAVNTRFRSAEVADILGRSGATVLACAPGFRQIDFLGILGGLEAGALAHLHAVIVHGPMPDDVPPALAGIDLVPYAQILAGAEAEPGTDRAQAPAILFTTSGTTRAPKFVLHRQAGIAAHSARVAHSFGFTDGSSAQLAMLPLCGVFGFNLALATFAAGAPLHLMPVFEADGAAERIHRHGISHLFGSDDMFDRLLGTTEADPAFPSVRWAGYAAFNSALADLPVRAEARGLRLCGLYGMSEIQALFAVQPHQASLPGRALAGGMPASPLARVRVREVGGEALLAPGEAGEVEIAGPSVMAAYFGDDEATARTVTADGFVRTGDLGHLTPDGGFVFLSRLGDVLRLGGFLVNPLEIEEHIQALPGVAAAQVVAAAQTGGTRPVAFVIPAPGAQVAPAAVIEHCRAALAGYKVPVRVLVVEDFPRTQSPNGLKIQRARLRAMAEEALAGSA